MVRIKQSDFNKDLDNYLFDRKSIDKTPGNNRLFSIFSRKNRVPKTRQEAREEIIEEMEELEEEIEELDENYSDEYDTQRREGLLSRFFGLLRGRPEMEEEYDDVGMDEEIKEVLKLSFIWLNKLPPQQMREFKASGDFDVCKDLLIKHGIAKEK